MRDPRVNEHPRLFPRSEHDFCAFIGRDRLIAVCSSEFSIRDIEYQSADTAVASAIERNISMMRLAAYSHDLRVLDFYQRPFELSKLVFLPVKQPAERRELHVFLLQGTVGK